MLRSNGNDLRKRMEEGMEEEQTNAWCPTRIIKPLVNSLENSVAS